MWLARKITYSKWAAAQGFALDELPADHVREALRTTKNTLSFWCADGPTLEEVREAALALVLSLSRLDAIDVVWVSKAALESDGISFDHTPGKTKLIDRIETHYDAVRLDVRRLGTVAGHLALAVRRESKGLEVDEAGCSETRSRGCRRQACRPLQPAEGVAGRGLEAHAILSAG